MSGDSVPECPDLKDMKEDELWEVINDNRHRISLEVRHCRLIPYLRQARVLTETDEDEINTCHNLTNRSMRTSYLLDLLRTQGKNGAVALLESLMIHYPNIYTSVTGRPSCNDLSRISGLVKYSELTEYLVRAITGMQRELQETRVEARQLNERCICLEAEISQSLEQEQTFRCLKTDNERLRRHLCGLQKDVTKLKDEKCDLYMRYTAAIEEKSAVNMRLHDLNLQMYQLQTELLKAQKENDFQKQRSLRCLFSAETPQQQEKVRNLCYQLEKAEKLNPARQDILAQDLAEAIDSQVELAEQLRSFRGENEKLLREKQEFLDKSEALSLEVQQLTLDCDQHQKKSSLVQNQMRELQKERDQAYASRDEAQAMIANILAEKDTIRCQLLEVQDKVLSLQSKRPDTVNWQGSNETKDSWKSPDSSFEESPGGNRRRLRRMDAINPSSLTGCITECEDLSFSSISSRYAEPPSPTSLRRRVECICEESSLEILETDSLSDDFVFLPEAGSKDRQIPKVSSCYGSYVESPSSTSPPPFLMRSRPKAIRISGRVLSISVQGEALLGQLTVVGGNKTGVFVHEVTHGSHAHAAGISPGAQIVEVKYQQNLKALRMVLEESTLEEAMWALGQVSGLCQLSLRPRQDVYEALLLQMQDDKSSGDSIYVRVNMSLSAGANGTLDISCNDILHVTNTQPAGAEDSWHVSQVHPCQLLDLQSGTVPNYNRAQRVLIRAIEDLSFNTKKLYKPADAELQNPKKEVRIVSTGRQGRNPLWVSVEEDSPTVSGDSPAPASCLTLMPYSPVTPHYPPTCRPVLVLPTVLGRILDKKLGSWQGFQLIEPEISSASASLLQKSDVLEGCEQAGRGCYTMHSVERVMQKGIHAVLPLGLDCVRRLHRAKIFPIIIFVAQSQRSARKLRSKLQRHTKSDKELLVCSKNEEPLLDKLPCLYHRLEADSWCDQRSLLTSLRTVIWEEQKKIVWVEPELW